MAKVPEELGALAVSRLTDRGFYAVGGVTGLYLRVSKTGARSWILRIVVAGKRTDAGLGAYPTVTLAMARDKARAMRESVWSGDNPIEERRAKKAALIASNAKAMNFSQCQEKYLAAHSDGWNNPKHKAQWKSTLDTYAVPFIGAIDVALIDTPLVLNCLEPIWKIKTETATRLRGRIESILDWATTRGYRQGLNPARWKGHLEQLLIKPAKIQKVEHHPALPYAEIGAFMAALRETHGMGSRGLEFAILTAARSGEVRGATWVEIDLDAAMWVIPADRIKAKREHRVPLSQAAIALLRALPQMAGESLIFPGAKKNKPLSDMSLTAVLKRMNRHDITVHGFRSTFRDWASEETTFQGDIVEMALAHAIGNKVEAAYRRGDLFEKRIRLMAAWANVCAGI
jgi:integrase